MTVRHISLLVIFALIGGLTGLFFGFFGTFLIHEQPKSVAPLTGVFVSAPIGLLVGLAAGGLLAVFNPRRPFVILAGLGVLAVVGVSALIFISLDFRAVAHLAELEAKRCSSVEALLDDAVEYWRKRIAEAPDWDDRAPRRMWEAGLEAMISRQPGLVFEWTVIQETWVEEQVFKGGVTWRRTDGWEDRERPALTTFVEAFGAVCPEDLKPLRGFYDIGYRGSPDLPPEDVSEFLRLPITRDIPQQFREFLP